MTIDILARILAGVMGVIRHNLKGQEIVQKRRKEQQKDMLKRTIDVS
jgi:hypothetical protein